MRPGHRKHVKLDLLLGICAARARFPATDDAIRSSLAMVGVLNCARL
jgi:hypothetical protein